MKTKYIFSMVAGLIVLVTTSCDKSVTVLADEEIITTDQAAPATPAVETPTDKPAAETSETVAAEATGAYYVMFKGKG